MSEPVDVGTQPVDAVVEHERRLADLRSQIRHAEEQLAATATFREGLRLALSGAVAASARAAGFCLGVAAAIVVARRMGVNL